MYIYTHIIHEKATIKRICDLLGLDFRADAKCAAVCYSVFAVYCSVLQWIEVCCSVVQCVAVCPARIRR